ncbi:sensor histidine kinase [Kribbella qitaiheensis]|uniref:histidine kinase n=1 Tax=Kribbella qitaiheensis TaxID=1544730 RepID=A0A7G6X8Q2_9ACTN|nr:histidine kinase [Kribbella qitaiheensis]QNE22617.1 sensor histidine kinase [Kribbella qitaiheensis]
MTTDLRSLDDPAKRDGWPAGWGGWAAGVAVGVVVVLTAADLGQHYRIPVGAALALGVARGVGLALAWVRPVASVPVSLVVAAMVAVVSVPVSSDEAWPWPVTSVFGIAGGLAIVGARGASRRELGGWWVVTQLAGIVAMLMAPDRGSWPGLVTMAVFSAVAVVVGDLLRSRADTRRQLAAQEGITADERAERARWQERARIARELHDVVAHHLSVVVVRADSAPHRLAGLSDDVREEFAGIAVDARSSLTEMRRVLRLLREDATRPSAPGTSTSVVADVQARELGPQPGLGELEDLVAGTRRAGADVRLEAEVPAGLDPAVELNAYRVVQEAVSNAVRHAPKAVVQVAVRVIDGELRLTVVNGPALVGVPIAPGSGQGLIGMRERMALVDGTLHAGPTADGGYLVEAAIPIGEGADR